MKCPHCGTENERDDRFCEQCGSPLQADESSDPLTNGQSSSSTSVEPSTLVRLDATHHEAYSLGTRAVIGRLDTSDLPVDDRSVSREHARLSRLREGYVVEDLGSTNGTLVNGRRIDEAVILRPGDILTVGSVDFRFEQQPLLDDSQHVHPATAWSPIAHNRQAGEPSTNARPESTNQFSDVAVPHQGSVNKHAVVATNERAVGANNLDVPSVSGDVLSQPEVDRAEVFGTNQAAGADGLSALNDRPPDPSPSHSTDVQAALDMADRFSAVVQGIVNELETARQRLETDRELLEHSRAQLQDAQNRLEELSTARDAALDELRTAQSHGTVRDDICAALENSPNAAMSAPDEQSLHALLDSLMENPRDIGVLMSISEHAASIRAVVHVASEQHQVLERIRRCVVDE